MEMVRQSLKSMGIRAGLVGVWLASASALQAEPPVCIDACALARVRAGGQVLNVEFLRRCHHLQRVLT